MRNLTHPSYSMLPNFTAKSSLEIITTVKKRSFLESIINIFHIDNFIDFFVKSVIFAQKYRDRKVLKIENGL